MYMNSIGFSLWCDFVERSFLESEFGELLEKNIVNAATSNPSIFKSAFLTSEAYAKDKAQLKGKSPKDIYESLAISDIQFAAAKLLPLYEKGDDGFISIEVDPFLCDDTDATIEEGRRLFKAIGFPNVMIKVPATNAGFMAMETLLGEGINVNATLIFSPAQTQGCLDAFAKANKHFLHNDPNGKLPYGVISIFVSRFDRKLDDALKKIDFVTSRVGIMNAIRLYAMIEACHLPNIRTLFASTGVKGDLLRADYYIRELLFKNSINTAPLSTIKDFIAAKDSAQEMELNADEVKKFFDSLEAHGIDMKKVYNELMEEGLVAFKEAFSEILVALK